MTHIVGKLLQRLRMFMLSAGLMTQCTDKMSELAAKAIEICKKKYIKSVMKTG